MRNSKLSYVDLFAGIGGFAAAFESLGLVNELAVEFDDSAARVYESNWGHASLGDVTKIAPEEGSDLNRHTILSAGFPCQPFSKSGAQLGVLDKSRGTLFRNVLSAIESGKPTVVVLENVRNLAGPKHRADLQIILESLRALGYRVSDQNTIVSPHKIHPDFGGRPQSRDRLFIVATRVPENYAGPMTIGPLDVYENIDLTWDPMKWSEHKDKYSKNIKPNLGADDLEVLRAWDDFIQIFKARSLPVPNLAIWTEYWGKSPKLATMPAWKAHLVKRNLELYEKHKDEFDEWAKKHSIFESPAFTPSKRKFEWQAQDMDSIFDGIIHFRPSGVRVKKFTYFPALVAITHIPILGPFKRRLTLDEAKWLQGLPDWFSFAGEPESKAFKQLGNGVNVGVVWRVLKSMAIRDRDLLELSSAGRDLLKLLGSTPESPDGILRSPKPGN